MSSEAASEADLTDVLHDCLSSFQGLDHSEGVCCFDRNAAVAYLLSPASGLRITLADEDCDHEWSERDQGQDRWWECWLCRTTSDTDPTHKGEETARHDV